MDTTPEKLFKGGNVIFRRCTQDTLFSPRVMWYATKDRRIFRYQEDEKVWTESNYRAYSDAVQHYGLHPTGCAMPMAELYFWLECFGGALMYGHDVAEEYIAISEEIKARQVIEGHHVLPTS